MDEMVIEGTVFKRKRHGGRWVETPKQFHGRMAALKASMVRREGQVGDNAVFWSPAVARQELEAREAAGGGRRSPELVALEAQLERMRARPGRALGGQYKLGGKRRFG